MRILLFLISVFSISLLSACQEGKLRGEITFHNLFNGIGLQPQSFTFAPENGLRFKSPNGITYNVKPNAFETENGVLPSGEIKLTFTDIVDIPGMILTGVYPVSYEDAINPLPLESAGQVYISAELIDSEEELTLVRPIAIKIPFNNNQNRNMRLFRANENMEARPIRWFDDTATLKIDTALLNYTFSDSRFGWTNVDAHFLRNAQQKDFEILDSENLDLDDVKTIMTFPANNSTMEFSGTMWNIECQILSYGVKDDYLYYDWIEIDKTAYENGQATLQYERIDIGDLIELIKSL